MIETKLKKVIQSLMEELQFNKKIEIQNIKNIPYKVYIFEQMTGIKTQYFIVSYLTSSEFCKKSSILGQQADIFNYIKKEVKIDKAFDKNVSWLVCVENEINEMQDIIDQKVLEVEEDPYCFKKLLLTFTEKSVTGLLEELNPEKALLFYLNEEINRSTRFENFMAGADNIYELMAKIIIKIPIINIKLPDKNEVEEVTLMALINRQIKDNDLNKMFKFLNNDMPQKDLKHLDNIENAKELVKQYYGKEVFEWESLD